jgi:uncharacterized protein
MKKQILVVHGSRVFESYEKYLDYLKNYEVDLDKMRKDGWKDKLQDEMGSGYDIIFPRMPSNRNAKYVEWKIWLENFFPFLKDGIILIGHSLGGIFLAKYLSENDFPAKIKAVFLVAAPYDAKGMDDSHFLGDFSLPVSLKKMESQAEKIFLCHSKDDPVVPFTDLDKYAQALPGAEKKIFEDKGHFMGENFPEIAEEIRKI